MPRHLPVRPCALRRHRRWFSAGQGACREAGRAEAAAYEQGARHSATLLSSPSAASPARSPCTAAVAAYPSTCSIYQVVDADGGVTWCAEAMPPPPPASPQPTLVGYSCALATPPIGRRLPLLRLQGARPQPRQRQGFHEARQGSQSGQDVAGGRQGLVQVPLVRRIVPTIGI